jgi:hypothetical protein
LLVNREMQNMRAFGISIQPVVFLKGSFWTLFFILIQLIELHHWLLGTAEALCWRYLSYKNFSWLFVLTTILVVCC